MQQAGGQRYKTYISFSTAFAEKLTKLLDEPLEKIRRDLLNLGSSAYFHVKGKKSSRCNIQKAPEANRDARRNQSIGDG